MLYCRRRALRALPLLLPLLLLRMLVPPGHMPANVGGELRLVMCSAGSMPADLSGHSGHTGHTGHGDGGDDPRPPHPGTDCPFAQAPSAAPVPSFIALGIMAAAPSPASHPWVLQLPPATGPPRTRGARAPPIATEEA